MEYGVRGINRVVGVVRDLSAVAVVAVAVAVATTLAGAVYDHVHQVDAEELGAREVAAVPGAPGTQVLLVAGWGVRITLPLAAEMPLVRYAPQSTASVGLSAADLEQLGPKCQAGHNALGALVRLPAGNFGATFKATPDERYVATVGDYDYIYVLTHTDCADRVEAVPMIVREKSVLGEALGTITATAISAAN